MRRTPALALGLLVLSGGSGSDNRQTRAEATAQLETMIDTTASAVANGLSVTPDTEAFSPSACLNGLGKDLGTMTFPYSVKLGIRPDTDISALFVRTRTYWESEGYEVDEPEFLNGKRPWMRAERDGYGLALSVLRDFTTSNIEGSTPCVANSG